MAIEFPCWNCGKNLKAPKSGAGKKCKCGGCACINSIPGEPVRTPVGAAASVEQPMQSAFQPFQPQHTTLNSDQSSQGNQGRVYCYKCAARIFVEAEICPNCGVRQQHTNWKHGINRKGHDRVVAAMLAFFLGLFGAHQFYLGNKGLGIIFLVFGSLMGIIFIPLYFFIPFAIVIPIISSFVVFLISLISGIIYLATTDEEFSRKYD
jgi:TM2 domain-containing membrane protein YozV